MGEELVGGATFRPNSTPENMVTIATVSNASYKQALMWLACYVSTARAGDGNEEIVPGQFPGDTLQGYFGELSQLLTCGRNELRYIERYIAGVPCCPTLCRPSAIMGH